MQVLLSAQTYPLSQSVSIKQSTHTWLSLSQVFIPSAFKLQSSIQSLQVLLPLISQT